MTWPTGIKWHEKARSWLGICEPTKIDPVKGTLTLRYCHHCKLGFWDPPHWTFTLHCPKCRGFKE